MTAIFCYTDIGQVEEKNVMKINKYHGTYNVQKRTQRVEYIVVHYTGSGTNKAGSALANCKYFASGDKQASAHYFIDDSGIWEYADPSAYFTWHCGDGHGKYGISNSNSIGIEVCMDGDQPFTAAEIRYLTELVVYLMNKFSVPVNKVVRHYDASRKMCPYYYAKRTPEWTKLRSVITGKYVNQWLRDDKGWKYYDGSGTVVKSQWVKWKGDWYYLKADGYMAASEWVKDSKDWCYLSSDGKMVANGWAKDSKGWCYCGSDGRILRNTWLSDGGHSYFIRPNGYMATGTIKINETFDSSGKWVSGKE